jgi:acetyl esterase/lipase
MTIMTQEYNETSVILSKTKTNHIERKMFDLSYASLSPAQKLDIYWPPKGNGPFPVIVSIHGGAFIMGDKRDIQLTPMLEGLKRGYIVISINYRMSGESKFPALVQDVKAAIRWIRANAKTHLFDPEKIATWGASAGGYLSLMAGVSARVPELEDMSLGNPDHPCHVQAVVDWFGPTDFLKMDEQLAELGLVQYSEQVHNAAESPESLLLGQKITEILDLVHVANPEAYIHGDVPPFFIQHGERDNVVPYLQSLNMSTKLISVLGNEKITFDLIKGAGHGGPEFETRENVKKVLDFLDLYLK